MNPYPFDQLPKRTRAEAALESVFARWLAVARMPAQVIAVRAGGEAEVDGDAAACTLRIAGTELEVRGGNRGVRRLAQQLLGGPVELDAPRPLTLVEERLWAHLVARAADELGIVAEVGTLSHSARSTRAAHERNGNASPSNVVIDLVIDGRALSVRVSGDVQIAHPPERPVPRWVDATIVDVPVVLGRCALPADALGHLAPRDVITLDRPAGDAELVIFGGAVGLRAAPNAVSATACTGYVARDMSLPDAAHLELTVALGTTQLTLRQVLDLAVGQIVSLGRPLAGPFELRAAGRVVGRGELIDIDGELGVRIVSLES